MFLFLGEVADSKLEYWKNKWVWLQVCFCSSCDVFSHCLCCDTMILASLSEFLHIVVGWVLKKSVFVERLEQVFTCQMPFLLLWSVYTHHCRNMVYTHDCHSVHSHLSHCTLTSYSVHSPLSQHGVHSWRSQCALTSYSVQSPVTVYTHHCRNMVYTHDCHSVHSPVTVYTH